MSAATPNPETNLAFGLRYAACGIRSLPIKPGTKRPPMNEWVQAATTDSGIITNWYTGMYADHGVGLAMGRQPDDRNIFTLDIDEHDPAHSGSETLADLMNTHGVLPDTVCSITGSGGMHLLFEAPPGVEVRNGIAGDGIDVRGEGGQIVVAPSIHPVTHRRYEWEDTFAPWERPIATAPDWLVELVRMPSAPATQPSPVLSVSAPFADPDSPAEWLRSWWNWTAELTNAGWTEHHVNRQTGDVHWTRPGKQRREGESAILHPNGPLVVFSTDASVLGLHRIGHVNVDGSVSVSAFEFFAVTEHHGDLSAAARFLSSKMMGADTRLSTLEPGVDPLQRYKDQRVDWDEFKKGDHARQDWVAEPLLPAGRMVALYAPAKQGKSEIAFSVMIAMATGSPILGQVNNHGPRNVLYFDYEMTLADLAERLEQLDYDIDVIDLSHMFYWSLPDLPPLDTPEGAMVVRGLAADFHAEAVVIDTLGRAVEGDENSNDTYRSFASYTGAALKRAGVACLRTDHAGKDKEKGQRGGSAKNDDADVVFRVDRIDDGWKLTRTHTRINWVPETVVIDRHVRVSDDGDKLVIALAPVSVPRFATGTGQFVAELQAAGIVYVPGMTKRQLIKLAQALDPPLSKAGKAMNDALNWMKHYQSGPSSVSPGGVPAPNTHLDGDRGSQEHTEDGLAADSRLSGDDRLPFKDIS